MGSQCSIVGVDDDDTDTIAVERHTVRTLKQRNHMHGMNETHRCDPEHDKQTKMPKLTDAQMGSFEPQSMQAEFPGSFRNCDKSSYFIL